MLGQPTVEAADQARQVQGDKQQDDAEDGHQRQHPGRVGDHVPVAEAHHVVERQEVRHRRRDESQRHGQQRDGHREVQHAQRMHQQQVQHRRPGAAVGEQFLQARRPRLVALRVQRTTRHAFTQQHLHHAPLHQRQQAHRHQEQQQQRNADDQDHQTERQAGAGHDPGEVERAGGQRQQHVEQRTVGTGIGGHAEEPAQQRLALRRYRRTQGLGDGDLGLAVDVGDFLRRAVAAGDRGDHLGFGLAGVLGQFRTQVFLRVVDGVLDHRLVRTGERSAQLL